MRTKMNVTILQQPLVEPVTLDEAKMHLRVDPEFENSLIEQLIQTGRCLTEDYTSRSLITQGRKVLASHHDFTVNGLVLPSGPFQGMMNHPKLLVGGRESTLSKYKVERSGRAARLVLEEELLPEQEISVEYRCGYGDHPRDVPQPLKQAVLLSISHLFENRGEESNTLPMTIKTLLNPYRVLNLA